MQSQKYLSLLVFAGTGVYSVQCETSAHSWRDTLSSLYCMGISGRRTLQHEVSAVFVHLCLCEGSQWSQQERLMYYSHMSNSVVVRRRGAALKVTSLATLSLPVLSGRTLCAEVSDLFSCVREGDHLSSRGLVSWCHSENSGFHLKKETAPFFK